MKNLAQEARRSIVLAWRGFATAERQAAWNLLARGFLYRSEPKFVSGRKPDFLTFGRGRMWVEVKEFDPPESQAVLTLGWDELTERFAQFDGRCRVDAWISPDFDLRVARQVTHLLSQELNAGLSDDRELYIAVPSGEIGNDVVYIEWTRRNGLNVRLVAYRSIDGKYAYPIWASPTDSAAPLRIVAGGTEANVEAYRVLDEDRPARALLRVEASREGRVLRGLGNSEAYRVRTVDRLREVVDDANSQLKNGQKHRAVPGVVVVFFDHLGGGDHGDVLRACLGDLTFSVDPDAKAITEAFYGHDGVFRPNKNTSTSAITYRSRHRPAVSLLNPHARYPVNPKWLDGTIYQVDASGAIKTG